MSGKVGDALRDKISAIFNDKLAHYDGAYERLIAELRDDVDAALSASPQDGWVLVPREPTQAMIDAATESLTGIGAGADHDYDDDARSMYAAFIRTLPQPTGDGT